MKGDNVSRKALIYLATREIFRTHVFIKGMPQGTINCLVNLCVFTKGMQQTA